MRLKQYSALQKFRAYWSKQSMLVRQLRGKHCLTEGSLLAFGRTLQLISERKSSSERFFGYFFAGTQKYQSNSNNTYYVKDV